MALPDGPPCRSSRPGMSGPSQTCSGNRPPSPAEPSNVASLLETFEGSAGLGGLLPEQVWDGPDMPGRELRHGGPSGSAMPLVWAHSERSEERRVGKEGRSRWSPYH